MIKKINNKNELPNSFDLKKYDDLASLSDKDLFRQLYWRSDNLECINEEFPDFGLSVGGSYPINEVLGDPFDEINSSEWFVDKQRELDSKIKHSLLRMSYDNGVKPLMRWDVSRLTQLTSTSGCLKGKPIITDDEMVGDLFKDSDEMFWSAMLEPINLVNDSSGDLMITIDLNSRDDVLIDSFSKLLPLWRKELNFPEPEKIIPGSWDSIRRKIIDYKIIPLIDLLSWEMATCSKISLGVLSVSLFPDGEKDAFVIAQTVKPFLEKIILSSSLDKIRKELSKEVR